MKKMEPGTSFRVCPRCGKKSGRRGWYFHCGGCDFYFYFNPAAAVAGIISDDEGRVLFVRRANDPAKGKLAFPGGFVDFAESAENALRREMREEVGVKLSNLEYLSSHPNRYFYRGLTYQTVDLFFVARARSFKAVALDEVASVCWLKPGEVKLADLAFPSVRKAWLCWRRQSKS